MAETFRAGRGVLLAASETAIYTATGQATMLLYLCNTGAATTVTVHYRALGTAAGITNALLSGVAIAAGQTITLPLNCQNTDVVSGLAGSASIVAATPSLI